MWIWISLGGLLVIGLLVAGVLITVEFLARQRRIMQMKRFRTSVRPQKADFTAEDKRTMI
jgi:hypothetical protein